MTHLILDRGFVDFWCPTLLNYVWNYGNLVEVVGQLGYVVEHPDRSQPNLTQVSEEMSYPELDLHLPEIPTRLPRGSRSRRSRRRWSLAPAPRTGFRLRGK